MAKVEKFTLKTTIAFIGKHCYKSESPKKIIESKCIGLDPYGEQCLHFMDYGNDKVFTDLEFDSESNNFLRCEACIQEVEAQKMERQR